MFKKKTHLAGKQTNCLEVLARNAIFVTELNSEDNRQVKSINAIIMAQTKTYQTRTVMTLFLAMLSTMMVWAGHVTKEQARQHAADFLRNHTVFHRAQGIQPQLEAVREVSGLYVFNVSQKGGFVVVSNDDRTLPVLGYSDNGSIDPDNMPSNMRAWLQGYADEIAWLDQNNITTTYTARRVGEHPTTAIPELLKTTWDQGYPYNAYCPESSVTGCVATAMAQVMNYWQWPKRGIGSHSYRPRNPNDEDHYSTRYTSTLSADFGNTTYDWENMLESYSGSETSAQKTAVATLMYHCGVATEMMYGNDADGGSGTYTGNYGSWEESDNAQNALWKYFGYKKSTGYMRDGYEYGGHTYYESWTASNWTAMVKAELDKQHPILYGGASDGGGHSFICDGYDEEGYFHFNWGWSGWNDGYFTLSNLTPGSGGAGGGGYDFSEDQDVIIGIEPDSSTYVDPVDPIDPIDPVDPTPGTGAFTLLTNISNLAAGDEVILVSTENNVAAATITNDVFTTEEVSISNNTITLPSTSSVVVMTVGKSGSNWTFTNNGQLLKATAVKKVKFGANTGDSNWTISISSGNATIQNGTESYGRFLYNVNNPRFTTYTSNTSSIMLLPQLYYRRPAATGLTNISAGAEVKKIIESGQIIIVRGNERYSIFGQKIQ